MRDQSDDLSHHELYHGAMLKVGGIVELVHTGELPKQKKDKTMGWGVS